ncbi:hypothetical protein ACQZ6C_13030 [Rhizobium rhizogenes]
MTSEDSSGPVLARSASYAGFIRVKTTAMALGADRGLSALDTADIARGHGSKDPHCDYSAIDFTNRTCIDETSTVWRFEMALAQLTSADASIGTIYVNPHNMVYVAAGQKYTVLATTVSNPNGVPLLLYVADSVEQVRQKLNIAMGKVLAPA